MAEAPSYPIPSPDLPGNESAKSSLIPLSILTVLTFLGGIALYIAATWGAGEGWFGRPVREAEEKPRTTGSAPSKMEEWFASDMKEDQVGNVREAMKVERSEGSQEFRFRVPSIDRSAGGAAAAQS